MTREAIEIEEASTTPAMLGLTGVDKPRSCEPMGILRCGDNAAKLSLSLPFYLSPHSLRALRFRAMERSRYPGVEARAPSKNVQKLSCIRSTYCHVDTN